MVKKKKIEVLLFFKNNDFFQKFIRKIWILKMKKKKKKMGGEGIIKFSNFFFSVLNWFYALNSHQF